MSEPERCEVLIVGAGPAGLSAAAQARANGLPCVLLERAGHLADTLVCYQKRKYVMAEPSLVPLRSPVPFTAGSREEVLARFEACAREARLDVRLRQALVGLERTADGEFRARTTAGDYTARRVILAIGTQGNPRRAGVPGEDLPHVSTRLVDPDEFRGARIVVVGAGDSALEVALALCAENQVTLVVRGPELVRAKESLVRDVKARQASRQIDILYGTRLKAFSPGRVELTGPREDVLLAVDRVFLKLGTQPPRQLLESLGVTFAGPDREAKPVVDAHYESSIPGLFLIGAVTGRDLIKLGMNQGYEVVEHLLGHAVEPADEAVLCERLPFWSGTARERILQLMNEVPLVGAVAEQEDGDSGPAAAAAEVWTVPARTAAAADGLREVLLLARPLSLAAGEIVVRQDDYTDSVLLIAAGRVAVSRRDEAGADRQVAVLSAGSFFGEMSLLSGRRRSATVRALGPVDILELPRKAVLKLLSSSAPARRLVDTIFLLRSLQTHLFPDLDTSRLAALLPRAELRCCGREEVIYTQGDPGDAFYLIRSGQVKLSRASGDRDVVITYLVAGNYFGEAALLAAEPRRATATTIFPSELIRIGREDFLGFLSLYPGLAARLAEKLRAERLRDLKEEATPGAGRALGELIREEVVMGTDALLIDEYKCIRCSNCIRACEGVHDDGQARLSLTGKRFANVLAPNSCWQCENPLCMLDCPPDALYRDARGEIHIRDNCIGCGNCEDNCPYGNIFMVHPRPRPSLLDWARALAAGRWPAAPNREVAVKCDLCAGLATGPACVHACPTGAAIRVQPAAFRETVEELLAQGGRV